MLSCPCETDILVKRGKKKKKDHFSIVNRKNLHIWGGKAKDKRVLRCQNRVIVCQDLISMHVKEQVYTLAHTWQIVELDQLGKCYASSSSINQGDLGLLTGPTKIHQSFHHGNTEYLKETGRIPACISFFNFSFIGLCYCSPK